MGLKFSEPDTAPFLNIYVELAASCCEELLSAAAEHTAGFLRPNVCLLPLTFRISRTHFTPTAHNCRNTHSMHADARKHTRCADGRANTVTHTGGTQMWTGGKRGVLSGCPGRPRRRPARLQDQTRTFLGLFPQQRCGGAGV